MYLTKKILPLCLLLFILSPFARAQQPQQYPEYDTTAPQLQDIQRLINATLPDIGTMLGKQKTFAPFATVILANDSIADIHVKDTTKQDYTVDELKEELSIDALKGLYKVVAIFYPDTQVDPESDKAIPVIAVFAEHTDDDFAYLFYYPYKKDKLRGLIFGDSFGDFAPQVMFKPD